MTSLATRIGCSALSAVVAAGIVAFANPANAVPISVAIPGFAATAPSAPAIAARTASTRSVRG